MSNDDWSNFGQAPQPTPELTIAEKVELVKKWLADKAALVTIKDREMELRKTVSKTLFPTPKKGTQRFEFDGGYKVKLVYKLNHKLGDAEKVDDSGIKISIQKQVDNIVEEIDKLGPQAELLADRLIKWTPTLSVSEYEKLDESDPIQAKIKDYIDTILTIEEASPELAFEEPKVS